MSVAFFIAQLIDEALNGKRGLQKELLPVSVFLCYLGGPAPERMPGPEIQKQAASKHGRFPVLRQAVRVFQTQTSQKKGPEPAVIRNLWAMVKYPPVPVLKNREAWLY